MKLSGKSTDMTVGSPTKHMGAGKIDRVKKGFRQSTLIVLVISLVMLPLFYIFGHSIADLFLKDEEIMSIDIATKALRITSLAYFGLGMIYVPRAVLNGCGDTRFAMIPFLGYWGIWVTSAATWITTAVVCCIRYFTGKWKTKSFVDDN